MDSRSVAPRHARRESVTETAPAQSPPLGLAATQHRLLLTAAICVVPLAAFLAFLIQPMLGKHLLPIFGGAVGTWIGTMLYFQLALLCGYGWAAWLVRRRPHWQLRATIVLGVLAALTFHLPSNVDAAQGSVLAIVWLLCTASLPAMMFLFSVSPLLHGWLQRRGQHVPYYVYAISNVGSLSALLAYPFAIEPAFTTSVQAITWHGFLFLAVLLLVGAGWLFTRTPDVATSAAHVGAPDDPIPASRIAMWLALSALTCAGMLGATHHLAVEIGSNPVSWVGPFGLYLLSFAVIFSGRWHPWLSRLAIAWLAISLAGYMVTKGYTSATVNGVRAWWLLSLTASASFVGNAVLYAVRPVRRFEIYYLVLAAGGVIGGLLSSVVIPYALPRPLEFIYSSLVILIVGMLWSTARREFSSALVTTVVLTAPVIAIGVAQDQRDIPAGMTIRHERDLYGHLMLHITDQSLVLSNETTTHGSQLVADDASRRRPTLYYAESTPAGRLIERLQAERPQLNVGVIGLGAGTLAAYARPGDRYDFWDIDPKTIHLAQDDFSFVRDAPPGAIHIVQLDGRLALQRSQTDYDLLIIDAFSGDGVPAHLLTREALQHYVARLQKRNGFLAIHTTSRYSTIFPVAAATGRSIGWSAFEVATDISASLDARDWDPTGTTYTVLSRPDQRDIIASWFETEEDGGRVRRTLRMDDTIAADPRWIWSDERHAAIGMLDLHKYFFE